MKTLIAVSLLTITCLTAFAGGKEKYEINMPYDSVTNKYAYNKVVAVPGKSDHDLYVNAKNWSKRKFQNEKPTIDEDSTEFMDKGNFEISVVMNAGMVKMPVKGTVLFTMDFQFKDEKYKLAITDIKLSDNASGTTTEKTMEVFAKEVDQMGGIYAAGKGAGKKMTADIMNAADTKMLELIKEIETALAASSNKSDW
ncbi:MAG TPA: DUF4468 domain-containing protein [Chitinophagales bacterium]|nr:DUF4468 domain-containing protein [Chitinophagales bacterium]